jgi:NOL1/NOP2/sun family putative RNA methylase
MSDFLPIEFENRMRKMLGDEYEAFETALSGERYRGLRVSPLKVNADGRSAAEIFKEKSSPKGEEEIFCKDLEPVTWAENGYYYDEALQPGKHPYHEAGVYYIQEPSAMLPGTLLEAKPGERVLDLCSAPGGKSTQIASYMMGKGLLVSNEINGQRARILSENIERMGIKNAVVTGESPASLSDRFEGFFDRIMVDAPCSGEGMFRKNEEAIKEWSPENVKMCAERQAEILDCAAKMLKAGGRIVYSTCTFAPEEDEESIENFLKRHEDFKVLDMHRLWPHKIKGEGHFAAVLEKAGENVITDGDNNINDTPLSKSDRKKIEEYLSDILKPELFEEGGFLGSGRLENFGDSVYLVPSAMPTLRGLKVLRPGLCLGSLKKDRFEPAHSLALAINSNRAKRSVDLTIKEAGDYIKGLTVNTETEKGWTLVTVNGYSLAWGKSAGGILKNHYPKGLRK